AAFPGTAAAVSLGVIASSARNPFSTRDLRRGSGFAPGSPRRGHARCASAGQRLNLPRPRATERRRQMKNRMLLLAAVAVLLAAPARAFHHESVGYCQGCHTMHNSANNVAMNLDATGTGPGLAPGFGYTDLLLLPNATDTCLRCHGNNTASYNVF